MARTTVTTIVDDIDGTNADQTVSFGLDGRSYELDLSDENAARIREDFSRWISAGRRTGGRRVRGTGTL